MTYIHLLCLHNTTDFLPYPNEATPFLINADIGTHMSPSDMSHNSYTGAPTHSPSHIFSWSLGHPSPPHPSLLHPSLLHPSLAPPDPSAQAPVGLVSRLYLIRLCGIGGM